MSRKRSGKRYTGLYRFDLGSRERLGRRVVAPVDPPAKPAKPVKPAAKTPVRKLAPVHYLRQNKRTTACGRPSKQTAFDTRDKKKVTCRVCLRAINAWSD